MNKFRKERTAGRKLEKEQKRWEQKERDIRPFNNSLTDENDRTDNSVTEQNDRTDNGMTEQNDRTDNCVTELTDKTGTETARDETLEDDRTEIEAMRRDGDEF